MTIGLERLLAHMGWANKKTIEHLISLPEDALSAFATNRDWHVGEIVHHLVDAADHYVFRITGEPVLTEPGEACIEEVKSHADLNRLLGEASQVDAALLRSMELEDEKLEFKNSQGNLVKRWRSTILSQSIHHATEHRAQIASALEAKGFKPVDLDELDLWSFEIHNG